MEIKLFRHATMYLRLNDLTFLLDPVLCPAGSKPPIINSPNEKANPLVELPINPEDILKVNGILVSHTHSDHLDEMAIDMLAKDLPVFSQPCDLNKLETANFKNIITIKESVIWEGIKIIRTGGQHGTGVIGKMMGPVSGFILQADNEPLTYITGDTIWCPEVEAVLKNYQPEVIIAYAGAACFKHGKPITMDTGDLYQVCSNAPEAKVIAVHMEAYNHCLLTRQELLEFKSVHQLNNLLIPKDGEIITL